MEPLVETVPPRYLRAGYCLRLLASCGLHTDPDTAVVRIRGLSDIWHARTHDGMLTNWSFFREHLRCDRARQAPQRRSWRIRLRRLAHRPAVWHAAAVFMRQRHILDETHFMKQRVLFCHAILHADTFAEAREMADDASYCLEDAQGRAPWD
ncbi:hypothetical protein [Palleronia abyssalis]|uniref:Uncharacterized protein n=1 Tax=Palleronia abyssalis TaxID=1501240 RepID=A0A2R8BZH3_9RHOB|nr:hypothetical protein [Palleronia abyssalis]SPJ25523.1 hypothetical protein PAA8504_03374 [Palleronia abyssalis]